MRPTSVNCRLPWRTEVLSDVKNGGHATESHCHMEDTGNLGTGGS